MTQNSIRPSLPPEAFFNHGAGRGDFLFVTVHLKKGQELLFGLDTGQPTTLFDKSLEPKLGKCFGTNLLNQYVWYGKSAVCIYRAPKLYLGNTRLVTGDWILTDDFRQKFVTDYRRGELAHRQVSGVLGMDCLQHYCLQFDFGGRKMTFLDPDHLKTEDLGKAFPLTFFNSRMRVSGTLVGRENSNSWIDTGDPNDGALVPKVLAHELQTQKGVKTKQYKAPGGQSVMIARIPAGMFGGETYTNLTVLESPDENIVGLRFLARHLVTFNFVKRTMYLKELSVGPLPD